MLIFTLTAILIGLCLIGLGIGKLLTGSSKLHCKRCGKPEEGCKRCGLPPKKSDHPNSQGK